MLRTEQIYQPRGKTRVHRLTEKNPEDACIFFDVIKKGRGGPKKLFLSLMIQNRGRSGNPFQNLLLNFPKQIGRTAVIIVKGRAVDIRRFTHGGHRDVGQFRLLQQFQQRLLHQAPGHTDTPIFRLFFHKKPSAIRHYRPICRNQNIYQRTACCIFNRM